MNNDTNNMNETVVDNSSVVSQNPSVTPEVTAPEISAAPIGTTPLSNEGQVTPIESQVVAPAVESQVIDNVVAPSQIVTPEAIPTTNDNIPNQTMNPTFVVEPTPQIDTPPAVGINVNAQNVTPTPQNPVGANPMPGFESSSVVGMTPPVSLEPEKKPEKPKNKTLFIVIVLVILAAIGFGTFYILKYTNILKSSSQATVTTNTVTVEVNGELPTDINKYATIKGTDSKNCTLNTNNVDVTKAGKYDFVVECGDTKKTGIVVVEGSAEPNYTLREVLKVKGESVEVAEFIGTIEDSDAVFEFSNSNFKTEYENYTPGHYKVPIKITSNGNTSEVEGDLVLVGEEIAGSVVCSSNVQNVDNGNIQMTVTHRFLIVKTGFAYGQTGYEITTFVFNNEDDYKKYMEEINNGERKDINNVTGKFESDDASKTITVTNYLDNQNLISSYGSEAFTNYGSISGYYTNTLGYSCEWKKSE